MPPRVGLIASRLGYEERRLLDDAHARGLRLDVIDHRKQAFALSGDHPAVAINREISSEKAAWVATTLEAAGARVINSGAAHRLAADKWRTHALLQGHGLPVPETYAVSSEAALRSVTTHLHPPWVLKHRHGSWGRNVVLADSEEIAVDMFRLLSQQPGAGSDIVLIQEFIPSAIDLRAIVVGDDCLGIYRRLGTQWRQNVSLGSRPVEFNDDPLLCDLAARIGELMSLDVCGVDVLLRADGSATILEVNSRVEFQGFEKVHDVSVAGAIIDHALRASGEGDE